MSYNCPIFPDDLQIMMNTISFNNIGMMLESSNNNTIYLNNFVDQISWNIHSWSWGLTNIWNSLWETAYTFNGKIYMNYLGNYWSNYSGVDVNGDGIGDAQHNVNPGSDNYPLMQPFEYYVITPDTIAPTVAVISPNGGETWAAGSTQNILWVAVDAMSGNLDYLVEYSITGGSPWTPIVTLTDQPQGTQNYSWTVPAANSSNCKIRITATDGAGNSQSKESYGVFTIQVINAIERKLWGVPVDFRFNTDLREGNDKPEVRYLQVVLNSDSDTKLAMHGVGSPGNENTTFGPLTKQAVIKFQEKYANEILAPLGLIRGTGYVGATTRAKLNAIISELFTGQAQQFQLLNNEERKTFIYETVIANKRDFIPQDFPSEFVLAIAAQETGEYANWNNEHVANDWGRGIMQITTNNFVGAGADCSSAECKNCKNRTDKVNCSKFYSNTHEGMARNVRDGLNAIKEKYNATKTHYDQCVIGKQPYTNCTKYGLSCQEMRWISTVQRYHGYFSHAQNDPQSYLLGIKNKLSNLYMWFTSVDQNKANNLALKVGKVWDNSQQITILSPCDLLIYDSEGRMTGLTSGEIKEEIPFSVYYEGSHSIFIPFPTSSYRYLVLGTDSGTYGLTINSNTEGATTFFTAIYIPISTSEVHQYTIDWDALSQGKNGVTLQIDANGDGYFERIITSDNELTGYEFMLHTGMSTSTHADGASSGESHSTTISTPNLNVTYLNVNPGQAKANQPITISANVVNRGDMSGSTRVALKINGKVEQTELVTVGPGGSRPVKFTVTKAEPGTYTVIMGSQRASFLVVEDSAKSNVPFDGNAIPIMSFSALTVVIIGILILAFRRPS